MHIYIHSIWIGKHGKYQIYTIYYGVCVCVAVNVKYPGARAADTIVSPILLPYETSERAKAYT